jgi:hypothetical protein
MGRVWEVRLGLIHCLYEEVGQKEKNHLGNYAIVTSFLNVGSIYHGMPIFYL